MHLDGGERDLDIAEIRGGEPNPRCAEVLHQVLELLRTGDGDDERLLRQQPCERELRSREIPLRSHTG